LEPPIHKWNDQNDEENIKKFIWNILVPCKRLAFSSYKSEVEWFFPGDTYSSFNVGGCWTNLGSKIANQFSVALAKFWKAIGTEAAKHQQVPLTTENSICEELWLKAPDGRRTEVL